MPRQHALDLLDGGEQVCYFCGGEVCESLGGAQGADEHVAWEERLEVHEGEGEGGCEEDLVGYLEGAEVDGGLGWDVIVGGGGGFWWVACGATHS